MFNNASVDSVFIMPRDVLKYMNNAKKVELRLIMYIFACSDSFTVEKAAEDLSESVEMINSALSFWRGTGIIREVDGKVSLNSVNKTKKEPENNPVPEHKSETYSTLDVANAAMKDEGFRQIIKFVEMTLGDLPNAAKQAQLFYLYDNLGMQSDVIIGIIAHCAAAGKTSMSYIKKTAEGIHNDGVVTYKELEHYLKAKEDYKNFENTVKRIIGAGERAFTKSEKKLVETWENQWNVDEQMLSLAYERTISLISKPSLPYMSKILENWHENGITTAQEAKELLIRQGQLKKKNDADEKAEKAKKAGFDIEFEDIFEKP